MFYRNILNHLNQNKSYDTIAIEGCSGCGKSTLMSLMERFDYQSFPEKVTDNYVIDKYFSDRKRYSFALQIFFLNSRLEHIKQVAMTSQTLLDRSIYSDVIFAKLANDLEEMSNEEFKVYLDLYKNMLKDHNPPKLIIYLESSVEGVVERIKRRGRDYEQSVEKEYWDKLNKNYIEYFEQYNLSPVLKINVDRYNFADNESHKEIVIELIRNKLEEVDKNLLISIH
jgi:deoxyadenosine/deoxycytidine kinase